MTKAKPNEITKAIMSVLEDYSNATQEALEAAAEEAAAEAVAELKATSPKGTGKYAKSWKHEEMKDKKGHVEVVRATKYQITHLLEYGYAKRNGGRVEGTPHIKPVADKAAKVFEKKLRQKIENGG